jgi:hypothetical protein
MTDLASMFLSIDMERTNFVYVVAVMSGIYAKATSQQKDLVKIYPQSSVSEEACLAVKTVSPYLQMHAGDFWVLTNGSGLRLWHVFLLRVCNSEMCAV